MKLALGPFVVSVAVTGGFFYILHPVQRNAYRDCNRHQQNKNLLQHSGITSLLLIAPGWRRPLADHE